MSGHSLELSPADSPSQLNHAVDELIQALETVEAAGDVAARLRDWCDDLVEVGALDLALVVSRLGRVLLCVEVCRTQRELESALNHG